MAESHQLWSAERGQIEKTVSVKPYLSHFWKTFKAVKRWCAGRLLQGSSHPAVHLWRHESK